ncbi:quinone-dependent dihydroorotate dehydrogenase [soil metagenome]
MSLYKSLLRPLAFQLDPERAHEMAMEMVERGLFRANVPQSPAFERELFGVKFRNPVGLAAGMDKSGKGVEAWQRLGFGFAEIGTITPRPQPGNPKPRLFRLPEDGALINRMGCNNDGAEAVAERLRKAKPGIPIGINVGKNKDTPLEKAPEDYALAYRALHELGDYFVVNVSSPNTPGLRTLQDAGALREIIGAMRDVDATRPLFVKVAPDLPDEALEETAILAGELNLTGIVATNTTISRESLWSPKKNELGGLSGRPVKERAEKVLRLLRKAAPPGLVLMGVGGIMTPQDAADRLAAGADLLQIYTGWIYGGPAFVPEILAALT